jgi:hypothetical protein
MQSFLNVFFYFPLSSPEETASLFVVFSEGNMSQNFKIVFGPKKIYGLKEDQAFSLSLELGRSEKVALHPSAEFLLHSVGGGW